MDAQPRCWSHQLDTLPHMPLDNFAECFWSVALEVCQLCIHCFPIMWARCAHAFDVASTLHVLSDGVHSAFGALAQQLCIVCCLPSFTMYSLRYPTCAHLCVHCNRCTDQCAVGAFITDEVGNAVLG